jgi:ribosomal protein S18 acetylase RimI-like enzyme
VARFRGERERVRLESSAAHRTLVTTAALRFYTPVSMGPREVTVHEITEVSDEIIESLARLLPQLSSSSSPPTEREVAEMASSPATVLFVAAEEGGRIVGSLTLAVFRIPTGVRAWIEDVVVDGDMRGRGVGGMLVRAALDRAALMGARTVDLTSRPSRVDANRLYLNLGFEPRETNVYRFNAGA